MCVDVFVVVVVLRFVCLFLALFVCVVLLLCLIRV